MPFNKRKEVCGKPTQYNLQTCEYNWRELSDIHFKIEERNRRIRNPLYNEQQQEQQEQMKSKENVVNRENVNVTSMSNINNNVKDSNNNDARTAEKQNANKVERCNQEVQTPELLNYLHNLEPRNNVHSNRSSPSPAGNEQYTSEEELSSPLYCNKYNNYENGVASHNKVENNNMGNVVLYYSPWSHEELRRLTYSNDAEARHSYLNRFAR